MGEKFHGRRYWPNLITIWHIDPEADGTDDSCGMSWPKLKAEDRKIVDQIVEEQKNHPYYACAEIGLLGIVNNPAYQYISLPPGQTLGYVISAWIEIKAIKTKKRAYLSLGEINRIMLLACNQHDGLQSSLTTSGTPTECARSFLNSVMRLYLDYHRPWWKHPRWHIHHWRIQFHPWQSLMRRLTKCELCGKRFGPRDSAIQCGSSFHNGKNKVQLAHSDCFYKKYPSQQVAE